MKRILMISAAVAVIAGPALAADSKGQFRSKGVGLESCQRYLVGAAKKTGFYTLSLSWMNGYLTAYNRATPSTYDIAANLTLPQLAKSLEGYCKSNPRQTLVTAIDRLTSALEPRKFASRADASKKAPVQVTRATMRKAQEALKKAGLYKGSIDGLAGRGTETAIAAYQQINRLPVTGQLDKPTQARLFAKKK